VHIKFRLLLLYCRVKAIGIQSVTRNRVLGDDKIDVIVRSGVV